MTALLALLTLTFVGHPLHAAGVPVLLPRTLPQGTPANVYANVDAADAHGYVVQLDFTADCDGATACNIGTMEGGVADAVSGSENVRLQNGIEAKFAKFECGASCGDSTLMFRYEGVTYRLGLKAASLKDLTTAADSLFPPR